MITVVVLTKNEEENLKRCLKSVSWAGEILVIDDNSIDKTPQIAGSFGAKVIKHPLGGDFGQQRNFALRQVYTEQGRSAKNDWVFFLDADEEVSGELKNEILVAINEAKQSKVAFYFKRNDFFMGKWLKHGEVGSLKILRLAKKGAGNWKRRVDEIWEIKKETKVFKNPLLHYPHPNLKQFLENINSRSSLNAGVFFEENKKLNFFEWLKPIGKFMQNYFFRFGFLDGIRGFIFAVLMSFHSFMVRSKLYLLWRKR